MELETTSTEATVGTEQTVDTAQQTDDTATEVMTSAQTEDETKAYSPFSNGKEKFVVNGKEVEWDWDTAKRYAQKGYSGMEAMQRAAEIEKKNKDLYKQLYQLAEQDPEALVRIFNPKYQSHAQSAQTEQKEVQQDPFEQRLNVELERRLAPLQQRLEAYEIAEERKAIEAEITEAKKAYPILDDELNIELLKNQYKKALQSGMDVSIEDVAFYLSQKLNEREAAKAVQTKQRIEQKRKDAPVHVAPQTQSSKSKAMDIEDVKRLAGLIS